MAVTIQNNTGKEQFGQKHPRKLSNRVSIGVEWIVTLGLYLNSYILECFPVPCQRNLKWLIEIYIIILIFEKETDQANNNITFPLYQNHSILIKALYIFLFFLFFSV